MAPHLTLRARRWWCTTCRGAARGSSSRTASASGRWSAPTSWRTSTGGPGARRALRGRAGTGERAGQRTQRRGALLRLRCWPGGKEVGVPAARAAARVRAQGLWHGALRHARGRAGGVRQAQQHADRREDRQRPHRPVRVTGLRGEARGGRGRAPRVLQLLPPLLLLLPSSHRHVSCAPGPQRLPALAFDASGGGVCGRRRRRAWRRLAGAAGSAAVASAGTVAVARASAALLWEVPRRGAAARRCWSAARAPWRGACGARAAQRQRGWRRGAACEARLAGFLVSVRCLRGWSEPDHDVLCALSPPAGVCRRRAAAAEARSAAALTPSPFMTRLPHPAAVHPLRAPARPRFVASAAGALVERAVREEACHVSALLWWRAWGAGSHGLASTAGSHCATVARGSWHSSREIRAVRQLPSAARAACTQLAAPRGTALEGEEEQVERAAGSRQGAAVSGSAASCPRPRASRCQSATSTPSPAPPGC